ncbi:DDT domain-containing protein PTM isoform X2 [Malania oleifera]|nr:DDT domain-containing protein PTM isoform X2 [Malania oleifera]
MEFAAIKVERRGRKRRRNGGQNNVSTGQQIGPETKKRAVETRSKAFIGRYVKKEFVGSGVFIGKIVSYDGGLYRVDYEDGDCEDLESSEVRQFLIADGGFDDHLMTRKKKLDELISNKDVSKTRNSEANAVDLANGLERAEVSSLSEVSCGPTHETDAAVAQVDGDADSSSDSCEYVHDHGLGSEAETPAVPPPPLPPSSGNIGVPEEYASHLFSVYSFLRSFSIRLFLSPFGLDDFVGSINCVVPNTLVDAIHVALMRALRRHLEKLSSDGSELASKCLRCVDWSLVDMLTWPVYLIHYLTIMGYVEGPEWKGFYADVLDREYYSLPVGRKLLILQILCDDVLESAELRAEIDMREESEVGIDSDAIAANPIENGPRRVHPRYSKTSACKDQEAIEIIADSHKAKSVCSSSSLGSKGFVLDRDAADVELDGNGDECRLCGMDGTLLCCDGCPSAYHSRCIGVSKMSIPEGSWFCPECTFNKIGPTITRGTSLRAAEIFGIDLYEQIFLGTCNHLLVLKASGNAESCFRYYNWNDIPKVLHLLCSSVQHTAFYSGICKAILHYWEIPDNIFSLPARSPTLLFPLCKESHKSIVEGENYASGLTEGNAENMAATFPDTSLDTLTFTNLNSLHREGHTATKQVLMGALPPELGKMEPTISTGSISHQADPSDLTHQSLADRSVIDFTTCTSGNSNGNNIEHVNGMSLPASLFSQSRGGNLEVGGRGGRNSSDDCLYMGSSFKPQAYINHYIHGDFAASAAAILAVLSSEENQASDAHALDNPRKLLSASVALQLKAFSSVAIRFFWPNSEKKIVEVPRERCGWCLSCKAPATSKKACLLNSAALNAIKGAMKILTGLRLVKNGKGSLPSIATYILYMEESLCGLIVGRFLNKSFRKQWRRHVEQASSCSTLKALLLEFEENIRTIAFSGDWVKLVDNWLVESSVVPNTACAVVFTQRRGPSSRRGRKQSAISEVTDGYRNEKLVDFKWWRGGKRSKVIFQKGILPYSMVKKAARQGGTRKISGMYYAESFEIPKRSRQAVWRAAVEMSKNASQLALQVRYLDLHVRWSDIPRPEQNLQDSKGPETEASAFRNAFICDKKIVDNMIRYGVAFGNQKHLPSRVMKNIIEVEENQDGKDKYWFLEIHIPLYLIKEYEERSVEVLLPSDGKPSNGLSVLQRRQLKASRRDIFSYLARKRDNLDMCSCASCQLNVFIR